MKHRSAVIFTLKMRIVIMYIRSIHQNVHQFSRAYRNIFPVLMNKNQNKEQAENLISQLV